MSDEHRAPDLVTTSPEEAMDRIVPAPGGSNSPGTFYRPPRAIAPIPTERLTKGVGVRPGTPRPEFPRSTGAGQAAAPSEHPGRARGVGYQQRVTLAKMAATLAAGALGRDGDAIHNREVQRRLAASALSLALDIWRDPRLRDLSGTEDEGGQR